MIIIGMLIALGFFFYMNNRRIKRMEDQHERSRQRFERLLESLQKKPGPDTAGKQEEGPGD